MFHWICKFSDSEHNNYKFIFEKSFGALTLVLTNNYKIYIINSVIFLDNLILNLILIYNPL